MKLHYSPTDMGFEWGQRSLDFIINEKDSDPLKIEFCDFNEPNEKGQPFKRVLYMSLEEQEYFLKLLRKSIKITKKKEEEFEKQFK